MFRVALISLMLSASTSSHVDFAANIVGSERLTMDINNGIMTVEVQRTGDESMTASESFFVIKGERIFAKRHGLKIDISGTRQIMLTKH